MKITVHEVVILTALVLAVVTLIQSRGRSLLSWAVLGLALVIAGLV